MNNRNDYNSEDIYCNFKQLENILKGGNTDEIITAPHPDFIRSDGTISSLTSRDLEFCIKVVLKEAVKEEKLIKQIIYSMLSTYTTNPINLAINAPSGEGKTHVLTLVGDLFPKSDTKFIAGMSSKAIFHKDGYIAIRNEDGKLENIESELDELKELIETKTIEIRNLKNNDSPSSQSDEIENLKKEILDCKKRKNEIENNAVKVIELGKKILVFLDTPDILIFQALMPLLSHDEYESEYEFADTSDRNGIRTKTNVLVGWPSVIFAQALDFSNNKRYGEIQRRFIITNPRMDVEKYRKAIDLKLDKNCLPDFVYQLMVVSDNDKETAREIILNIRDDLLFHSSKLEHGKNNILIPYRKLINQIFVKDNPSAQDITFVNRIMNLVGLITSIKRKNRPYLKVTSIWNNNSEQIPISLYTDITESFSLIQNSVGGVRPYVLEWYNKVFLELYLSKSSPNSREKNGDYIVEQRIAVTTQELIEKTYEILKKKYPTKKILTEYVYPLLNLGYVDSIQSELDKRAKIYFPVIELEEETIQNENTAKNIFLLHSAKKNNLSQLEIENNINSILDENKKQIISYVQDVRKYYSENGYSTTLSFAEYDRCSESLDVDYEDMKVEDVINKYFSKVPLGMKAEFNDEKNDTIKSPLQNLNQEDYYQTIQNSNILQHYISNHIKNKSSSYCYSNNIFNYDQKNKLIYSCYWCIFESNSKDEYERHCVQIHPGKLAYPSIADITKNGLKAQGTSWE